MSISHFQYVYIFNVIEFAISLLLSFVFLKIKFGFFFCLFTISLILLLWFVFFLCFCLLFVCLILWMCFFVLFCFLYFSFFGFLFLFTIQLLSYFVIQCVTLYICLWVLFWPLPTWLILWRLSLHLLPLQGVPHVYPLSSALLHPTTPGITQLCFITKKTTDVLTVGHSRLPWVPEHSLAHLPPPLAIPVLPTGPHMLLPLVSHWYPFCLHYEKSWLSYFSKWMTHKKKPFPATINHLFYILLVCDFSMYIRKQSKIRWIS